MTNRLITAAIAGAIALPLAIPAAAQITTTNVSFPRGATSTTINGAVKGEATQDYVVRANAGQTMTVQLSGSQIVYFNVLPPGSNDVALHNSNMDGNVFKGTLSAGGAYKIRVYQMRATGRRGEVGNFRLTVGVTGGSSAGGGGGGSRQGSIAGIQGMDAFKAFDELRARGFASVDTMSSGDTMYGVYYYRATRLCVQTTSADNRIIDIRDIKTHPKCR